MPVHLTPHDRVGLARPALDAHTLGLASLAQLLGDCGVPCLLAGPAVCEHLGQPGRAESLDAVADWIRSSGVTVLGVSYRLDPADGAELVDRLARGLEARRLLAAQGGPLRAFHFAGLPETCERVRRLVRAVNATFEGDETPAETLEKLGVDPARLPRHLAEGARYDEDRLAFGRDLVRAGGHRAVRPVNRSGYPEFGGGADTLEARLEHGLRHGLPPLMRAHAGPYLPDRAEAVRLFLDWCRRLAADGLLDVLSIGTSQLSQSHFGEDWGPLPDGGGVPLNSPEEFEAVWRAARPMLVRTYAGTSRLPELARMYEQRIRMAWHALSLWWFCRLDGRGPYPLRENLRHQVEALRVIAAAGKPYEPNVAHHFAFRGGDDVTGLAATVLAARTAKRAGIRRLVLQVMLNTPRPTWGVQDLAKARALLALVRPLEDASFRVFLQPRGGLDYFSPKPEKAMAQLAAVTALMDDIEPRDEASPPLIHVVSYSEGYALADPAVIGESIQLTRHALESYRRLRRRGDVDDMTEHPDVAERTAWLREETRTVLRAMEAAIPDLYTPEGLYQALARGFLAIPYLWACREELAAATRPRTRLVHGAMKVVDPDGRPIPAAERMAALTSTEPLQGA